MKSKRVVNMGSKAKRHTDQNKRNARVEDPSADAEAQDAKAAAEAAPESAEGAGQEVDELTVLRQEIEALREKNLRVLAESENLSKRSLREMQESLRFAAFEFARDLLVVLDDLERTLESSKTAANADAVTEGVRIVYEHMLKIFSNYHIEPIEAVGRPFDPGFHEAMLQQPSDTEPRGTVLKELARGYVMHERVLRPSRVIVSSGPPESKDGEKEQRGDNEES